MRRQCARSGCTALATVTFTFDSRACTVWLDPVSDEGARAGDLCDRHTRRLAPPRGWELVDRRDRRTEHAAVLDAAAGAERAAPTRRRVPRPHAGPPLTTPSFDDLAALDAAIDVPIDVPIDVTDDGAEEVAPWAPRFDPADDLDGLLDAQSPLLGRAFRNLRAV